MCDFLSFFVHRKADKRPLSKRYKFGDMNSHSKSAILCGIKYENDGDEWAEAEWTGEEWTGEDEKRLVVRDDRAKVLMAVALGDFKTRADALKYGLAHTPKSLTSLDLSYAKIPPGTVFPESLTSLNLYEATIPPGTVFPPKCKVYR